MPATDSCHEQVVRALQKEGWVINSLPFRVRTNDNRIIFVDIEAFKEGNGQRDHIMLAEVKCFPDRDKTTRDLYISIGQYLIYRAVLAEEGLAIPLYLSVPEVIYHEIFDSAVRRAIKDNKISLIIVNLDMEMIVQWIE